MQAAAGPAGLRLLLSGLLAVAMLVPAPGAADADPVVFCFNDWPPYTVMNEDGPGGITVRIVERAAELLGREARFIQTGWSDCLQRVERGEYDAVLDAARRDAFLQGPTSFNSYTDTFWVRNSSNVLRYDQLQGGRVALVEGYNYAERLYQHIGDLGLEIVRGLDDPSNIRDLAQGKVDAAVADLASTLVFTADNNLPVSPILPPFSVDSLYPSFNRDRAELQRDFDRVFAELLRSGYVDAIYEASIGVPYSSFAGPN